MSTPKASQLRSGAKIITPANIAAGQSVTANVGDAIAHERGGWHICVSQTPVTMAGHGLGVGQSNDQWHYSTGPSHGCQGVPPASNAGETTFDSAATGFGTDGRMVSSDGTIGGTPGAAGSGSGGGSATRGF
jgi:hypothetical protein